MQFYTTLADWWPLLSPVDDYAEEADELQHLIATHHPSARTLLELGSGGGHIASYLRSHYVCCLTDLSAEMLAVSRRLNPTCEHVQGDMRTLDLGRTFDVVLAHDAIDYMTSERDLALACDTAWRHLAPGGLVVLLPDTVAERYEPGTDVSGGDGADGRSARLFEWSEAVAPGTTQAAVHYAFLLREADGQMHTVYERHETGVFPEATWVRILTERGFAVRVVSETSAEDRQARRFFLGSRPARG
jgi:SAM-dependent methyltransferase